MSVVFKKLDDSWYSTIFSVPNLTQVFETHIRYKKSKGLDKISPRQFAKDIDSHLVVISRKCLKRDYRFTRYVERLLLKKKGVPPRVLCVPTVRDKVVLKAVNEALKLAFQDKLTVEVPNQKVRAIKQQLQSHPYEVFLKVDIQQFYDHISHEVLIGKIKKRIKSRAFLKLLNDALHTPAVPSSYSKHETIIPNEKGVHQGLPISNLLAEIYLADFDAHIRKLKDVAYFRYVDDILVLTKKNRLKSVEKSIRTYLTNKLALTLNEDKRVSNDLGTGFEYLGYKFELPRITIRKSSKQKFLNSLFKEFVRYKYKKKEDVLIRRLNLRITGAISENKRYGWVAFFSEINDVPQLYAIDKLIKAMAERFKISTKGKKEIKRLVRAYHEMKHTPRGGYIFNFDTLDKREILIRFGDIEADAQLTDEELETRYERFKIKMLGSLEEDVGQFS